MTTRREAIARLGAISAGTWLSRHDALRAIMPTNPVQGENAPPLAPGAPASPERMALIDAFKQKSAGLDAQFEARTYKSDWTMPYRLFRPKASGTLPLVVFLHGSGGLGDDNVKQMGLGNIFGTRLWALPEVQKDFPCYVLVPQTDRGWVRYAVPTPADSVYRVIPGLGEGARAAFELIDALRREFAIDERRIYVTGQSMGGAGAWHMVAQRPKFFAAAVPCCGSASLDDVAVTAGTPIWAFHGDADQTVPVTVTRERIAALKKAGGHPIYTEYAGVDHNSWQWAYTEPALARWMFGKRR